MRHKVVFVTHRGEWHQQSALDAAPEILDITMLRDPDPSKLLAAIKQAEYLITERSGKITGDMIRSAPHLRLIQRLGSLVYDIDLEAARQAGVSVCYFPVLGSILVAEHIVMQILAVGKKLREDEAITLAAGLEWGESRRTDEDTFAYNWSGRLGVDQIWRRTIGILGFGEIGVELSRRMQSWGCDMLYHKRTSLPEVVEEELGIQFVSRDELVRSSDYLVNLLPFSETTDLCLNEDTFSMMKAGAFLVSCGSGSTIDESALAEAVIAGKLGGAALDTFEFEPIQKGNPLLLAAKKGYNILLTPHTAAGTPAFRGEVPDRSEDYANILRDLAGERLEFQVV
jgi:phosphoglycerate dehydrogenase-like enzyme